MNTIHEHVDTPAQQEQQAQQYERPDSSKAQAKNDPLQTSIYMEYKVDEADRRQADRHLNASSQSSHLFPQNVEQQSMSTTHPNFFQDKDNKFGQLGEHSKGGTKSNF